MAPHERSSGRARSMARNIGTTLLVQMVGIVTGALAARLLGPVGRGLLAGITNISSSAAAVGDAGGPTAYAYQVAKAPSRVAQLVRNAYALVAAQTLVIALGGSLVMLLVLRHDGMWKFVGVAFLVCYVPLNLLARYFAGLYQGQADFRRFNWIRLSLTFSYASAIVALFVFSDHALLPVVAATLGSNVIAATMAAHGLFRRGTGARTFDRALARQTFSYGIRAHLGNLSPIDTLQVDIAVVIAFLGPRQAGLYAVGSSAATVVRSLGVAIGLVALPSVAGTISQSDANRVTGLFFRAAVVVSGASAAFIWLAAGVVVPLVYGAQFNGSISVVRILVVGAAATSVRQVLNDSLRGSGRPLYGSIAELTSWVALCGGLVVFVPLAGLKGAAVAVVIAYLFSFAVILTLAVRSGPSLRELCLPTSADVALLKRQLARLEQRLRR